MCKVRFNEGGRLRVPWGYVGGVQCDPIEKKPFFHAHPGALAYSFGMLGCDLHCVVLPELGDVAGAARSASRRRRRCGRRRRIWSRDAVSSSARVMVSTYNEPLITERVGGCGIQGSARRRFGDRVCLERQRHAGSAGLHPSLGRSRTRSI